MKSWVRKLIDQFQVEPADSKAAATPIESSKLEISEEKATLLFMIDLFHKHLIEIDAHPVRKVRELLDKFGKGIAVGEKAEVDRTLFEMRQWFSSYRLDETTYIQNTFDDFKRIIWEFADNLHEEAKNDKANDEEISESLEGLREAVESNSIEVLRAKSKEFISFYIDRNERKSLRRQKSLTQVRKNLDSVKKQLIEANQSMLTDHLTGALNRRSFDERLKNQWRLFGMEKTPCSLIIVDIDFFKKVNDNYGHDFGDFVLKECVRLLNESFKREKDVVCRMGGEEFGIILPGMEVDAVVPYAEAALNHIRKEVFLHNNQKITFTVSMGVSQLLEGESWDQWLKRADVALYSSKNGGRNRLTVAPPIAEPKVA